MQSVDVSRFVGVHSPMPPVQNILKDGRPLVVGSFGNAISLAETPISKALNCCDIAEIRLDLLAAENFSGNRSAWTHLTGFPLLFTARRKEEGGALSLNAEERSGLLRISLEDATLVDVELASIEEMKEVITEATGLGIPWIASFHDFEKLPSQKVLLDAVNRAHEAGAAVFKVAAKVTSPAEVAELAEFQLLDHPLPVSTMGMGPLAPVSRLLCAQSGSVLNYGFIGEKPTAPGQWESQFLKQAIARITSLRS